MNVKFCLILNIFPIYLYFSFNMPKAGWLVMNIFNLIGNFYLFYISPRMAFLEKKLPISFEKTNEITGIHIKI